MQLQDSFGNPVTTGITVNLSSNSTGYNGGFFTSDSAGHDTETSVTIAAGSSSGSFYYYDNTVGSPVLTSSATGLTSATTQFTINNYRLAFTGGSPQTLAAGTMSNQITIQRQTSYGGAYTTGAITVNLATNSTGGAFYATSTSTTPETTVSIASGESTATFYYKDSVAGTPALTVSSTGYASGTAAFTITGPASKLSFTAGTSQTLSANTVSSVITVQLQDSGNNPINSGSAISVSLAATGTTTGVFYSNSGGTTIITSVTINAGSNSASFYYKDTTAGSPTITASYTGLTSATTTFTITGAVSQLVFLQQEPANHSTQDRFRQSSP